MSRSYASKCGPRQGFTLVELLVVIAIIGILVALLLPAIQAAREAARRSQCSNNLKQLGLALHMHHDQEKHFPPGHYSPSAGTSCVNFSEATWVTHILPFLEYSAAYDQIDRTRAFGCGDNLVVTEMFMTTMHCPSDRRPDPSSTFARGNYAANNGIGPMREWCRHLQAATALPPVAREGGVFYINSNMPMAEIRDGTSQTVMISEIRVSRPGDFRGVMHYPEAPLYHHNYTPNSLVPDQIRTAHCNVGNLPEIPCQGAYSAWNSRALIQTARSYHPGGVQVAMADGSVRFVAESISLNIWRAISTPVAAPGEPVVGSF